MHKSIWSGNNIHDIVANTRDSLYGTAYQFSKGFFTGWVIVSLLWAIFAIISVTIYPIIEERRKLLLWIKYLAHKRRNKENDGVVVVDQHRQEKEYGIATNSNGDHRDAGISDTDKDTNA